VVLAEAAVLLQERLALHRVRHRIVRHHPLHPVLPLRIALLLLLPAGHHPDQAAAAAVVRRVQAVPAAAAPGLEDDKLNSFNM
jgi:hypothetical protein